MKANLLEWTLQGTFSSHFDEGWNIMIPDEAIHGVEDSMKNYEVGYFRHIDGSWEPRDVPGFPKRKKKKKLPGKKRNKRSLRFIILFLRVDLCFLTRELCVAQIALDVFHKAYEPIPTYYLI